MHRYAELKPASLEVLITSGSPAIIPWGALEWHGAHLPFGLDGLLAEAFCERLAERVEGVLLPTQWNPLTTLPHRHSLEISTGVFRMLVDETISALANAGFRRVAIVTGHYAQGHLLELYDAALRATVPVFVGTPLELLGKPELLDHAGRYEVSQFMALRPDLADLSSLPEEVEAKRDAVLGNDPREGSAAEGHKLWEDALSIWADWLNSDPNLVDHYTAAKAGLQPYVDLYFRESWQQAIRDWWETKQD